MKRILTLLILVLMSAACTKVIVYAGEYPTPTTSKRYAGEAQTAFYRSIKALETLGYPILTANQDQYHIVTGWRSTPSGGFYKKLFKRRDYSAASGSYYQVLVDIVPEGNFARVDIRTTVKSIAGEMDSSGQVEQAFFKNLDNVARSPHIEITNVGLTNK